MPSILWHFDPLWKNILLHSQMATLYSFPTSTAVRFVLIFASTGFALHFSQITIAKLCITPSSSCATTRSSGYHVPGFAGPSNVPFYQMVVAPCPAQLPTVIMLTLATGAQQLTFRSLALRTHPHNLGLLYHLQPTEAGTRPMERISSATAYHPEHRILITIYYNQFFQKMRFF